MPLAVDGMRGRALNDRDQTTHDLEQIWSDHDQTASDQDQTWSDHDQTMSDSDQRSSDEDQHAADHDFAAGGDAATYFRGANGVASRSGSVRCARAEAGKKNASVPGSVFKYARLRSAPMQVAQQFLAALARDWDGSLDALKDHLSQ